MLANYKCKRKFILEIGASFLEGFSKKSVKVTLSIFISQKTFNTEVSTKFFHFFFRISSRQSFVSFKNILHLFLVFLLLTVEHVFVW